MFVITLNCIIMFSIFRLILSYFWTSSEFWQLNYEKQMLEGVTRDNSTGTEPQLCAVILLSRLIHSLFGVLVTHIPAVVINPWMHWLWLHLHPEAGSLTGILNDFVPSQLMIAQIYVQNKNGFEKTPDTSVPENCWSPHWCWCHSLVSITSCSMPCHIQRCLGFPGWSRCTMRCCSTPSR